MEKKRVYRMIHCRRASFANTPGHPTLEAITREAFKKLPLVDNRRFNLSEGRRMSGLCCHESTIGGLNIQIAIDTPGDSAPLVPRDGSKPAIQVGQHAAPPTAEYMDGESIVHIRGNIVIICSKSVHNTVVESYLRSLLVHAEIPGKWGVFSIEKVSDVVKLNMIRAEGVKNIRLSTTLYSSTIEMLKAVKPASPMEYVYAAAGSIVSRFKKDERLSTVREDEEIGVSLVLDRKGRVRGGDAQKRMNAIGEDAIDNCADGFTIVTNKGQSITSSDVALCKRVLLTKYGKTVDHDTAWAQMTAYYTELMEAGHIRV